MRYSQRSGPPSWFIILLSIAIVFGVYYLWLGLRSFMATGVTVAESTRQAITQNTATAVRVREIAFNAPTPLPSFTPVPPCQDFEVRVPIAIVRKGPDINSSIVESLRAGAVVCVIAWVPDTEWYLIDQNALTRRIESVYMHRDIVRALHPTATATKTLTPTETETPTETAVPTETPLPTTRPTESPRTQGPAPRSPSPTASERATAVPPSINL